MSSCASVDDRLELQVGDDSVAWQSTECCEAAARAERAVTLAPESGGLAGVGQQAAPPCHVCGFPPAGALPGRGLADLAPICTVCQDVKKPRHGCDWPLHCQDHSTGEQHDIVLY